MKYLVTKDFLKGRKFETKELAIQYADLICGDVFINPNNEMVCIYSYKDKLNLKPITLNGDMAKQFNQD